MILILVFSEFGKLRNSGYFVCINLILSVFWSKILFGYFDYQKIILASAFYFYIMTLTAITS